MKMTCRRVPAEPRRPVRFQNICMPVNRCFLSLYCIQQGVHSELMGTRFCFRDGDCSGVFVERDGQFSLFCCFGNESRL